MLRQTHFRLLRGAVVGRVHRVKNLGDGLMVMFRRKSGVGGRGRDATGDPPHNRSAVAARRSHRYEHGEAVEEDGDYFGDPVVVSARLCAAEGGQIWLRIWCG